MFALSRLSIWAAVGGLVVMLGGYSLPVRGEEPVQNLGPVGPNEAIPTSVGNKRFIAFNEPVVMWDSADDSGNSPARVRVSLNADQRVFIDSPDHKSVALECGDFADTLKIVENKLLTAGDAQ